MLSRAIDHLATFIAVALFILTVAVWAALFAERAEEIRAVFPL